MTFDPFAPAPAAAPEPTPVAEAPTATVSATPAVAVAPSADGKIVVTLKGGAGFDAPWIVIHASTVAEADALLDQKMVSLMERTKRAAAHFSGGSAEAPPSAGAAVSAAVPAGAQAPERPADVPADFVFKSGISKKNGQPWKAWMPPTQGDSRSPVFIR